MWNPFGGKKKKYTDEDYQMIYKMFHHKVYQTAYFVVKDSHLTHDVLQETFLKAFKKLDTLTDLENLGPWLGVIATRTAIDVIRKNNNWNGIPTEDVLLFGKVSLQEIASSVEDEVEHQMVKAELLSKIQELKPEYREILVLKYYYDLKDQEIASSLDINIRTVKSRHYRAKQKLQTLITNDPNLQERELS